MQEKYGLIDRRTKNFRFRYRSHGPIEIFRITPTMYEKVFWHPVPEEGFLEIFPDKDLTDKLFDWACEVLLVKHKSLQPAH